MSVLLPNAQLGVRRRAADAVDALGDEIPGTPGPLEGPWPGRAAETADGRWTLAVDPAAWPVREHDLVTEPGGRTWAVDTAQLIRNNYDPSVDWIRVAARQVVAGGTEPGGAEFTGRD